MDAKLGPLQTGARFLKWEIRGLMGRGGHAYVYDAHDPFLSLDVAIKIIPSSRDTGRDLVARARSEARVLVRISHPNVVKIMDAGATDDGIVYLVMEKLTGRDLRKALRQYGRLTPLETLRIAVQAAEAVAAAHAVGAIHRDLKPENLFLCRDRLVKVLDFGIAKVMGYGAPTTQKDLLHGTVLYMPPEQLKGFGVTARSDIFSLGTLLYEAMHHHPALLGKSVPTVQELGWIQIERLPPLLSKIDQSIPPYVARFIQRAIMKDPGQRYASMAEMAEAARATLARLTLDTKSAVSIDRDLSVVPEAEGPPSSATGVSGAGDTELISGAVPPPPNASPRGARNSESQLTPPPTISLISERPPSLAARLGGELPWRKLAVTGSIAGLGLGVLYAAMDARRPSTRGPDTGAASAPMSRQESQGPVQAMLPTSLPAAPSASNTSANDEREGSMVGTAAEAPATTTTIEAPAPSAAAPKSAAAGSAKLAPKQANAAKGGPRSAMDERLDWLERDLKGKSPPAAPPPAKRSQPDFPSLGVGERP